MSLVDEAAAVRAGEALDATRLGAYLAEHLPGLELPLTVRQFPAGFSNLTYLLSSGARQYVLRRPPFGTRPKSGHDMGREFRVLTSLKPGFPECPAPIHHCEDESVIGAPFYLVERIRGIILRRDYPPELPALPKLVHSQQCGLVDALARLHRLDYRALGLTGLGRPDGFVARQVEGWAGRYERARTPDARSAVPVAAWLAAHVPPQSPAAALIHNDYKLDNVVFDAAAPEHLVGVLDWEMATIGDPLMDLGCSLAYWIEAGDPPELRATRMLPTHLPGALTRAQVLQRYAVQTSRELPDFRFFRVFGLFRLAVIVQQIYYRYFLGQTRDPRFGDLGRMAHLLLGQASAEIHA